MSVKTVQLKQLSDILVARRSCRELAKDCGFGSADQTRLATAVSEIARNVIQYAGEGLCVISQVFNNDDVRIMVEIKDEGPGIIDVEKALENGYSTSGGLGAGLPGAKRLVHEFQLESKPGKTLITLIMKRKRT